MPPAQRPSTRRRVLIALPLAALLAGCGTRVAPVPLDGDPEPLAAIDGDDAPEQPADAIGTLHEEVLPEIEATPAVAPEDAVAGGGAAPAEPPAPGGGLAPAPPSPLASIGPHTAPNVAAATRLADAARARIAAGDEAAAIEQLERAIAIDPNNPFAYYFLAELHVHTHGYDQAIAFADRAASLSTATSPEWTSRAWALQGNAFEASGRLGDARQAYLRAVRAAPSNLAALVGLARLGGGGTP